MQTLTVFCFLIFATLGTSAKTLYLLAVDGLSYESFQVAQKMGYFKDLKSSSAHIAPFPTMTDLSWSEIVRSNEVFGVSGRIRSVEAAYFDESQKSVAGDVRDYYRRLAEPKYYLSAFQSVFNPYIEALMYFPTKELPKKEFQVVFDGMLASTNKSLVTGYIGAIDSTAHTQKSRLYPVIQDLDLEIRRFLEKRRQLNDDFELIIVSDHGNVGTFEEGESEKQLVAIEMEPILKNINFNFVSQLQKDNDVAMPLMALGSWAPVYLKNRKNIPTLVKEMTGHTWFDLAIQLMENSPTKIVLSVASAKGYAKLTYFHNSKKYQYDSVTGNPLEIPKQFLNSGDLTSEVIESATRSGPYPDSLIRLVDSVKTDQFDFPDLILTFKDGYYLNNSFGKLTTMYRTHGSLSRMSTLGVLASTHRALPQYIRSRQILSFLEIDPKQLFGAHGINQSKTALQTIEELNQESKKGVPTGARDLNEKRIFQLITKLVSFSRAFFVIDEIKQILSAFTFSTNGQSTFSFSKFDPSRLESKEFINPNQIGELTDLVIKNPDFEKLQKDPAVLQVLKDLNISRDESQSVENSKGAALAAKRSIMKVYQIPYFLEQSLKIQEKPYLPENRDLSFAYYWEKNSTKLQDAGAKRLNEKLNYKADDQESIAERLFHEIHKESLLEDRIAPQPLKTVYRKAPTKTTIVYLPGTYNGIFDREIFSLGLLSLQEELGLRVLKVPTMSACASEINADDILKFLKEDQRRFIERNETPPRYILIGYSKGAIDTLYSAIQDKDFVKRFVDGIVAIAAPLHGSPILEKADLPFFIVNLLIDEDTPAICRTESPATQSVSSQGMSRFWRKHETDLIGLTRYFSISFAAEPEESHLFMKITKMLAQFEEDNDGIVGVSASKFPKSLDSVDLGTIKADHLSGILSSRFNQRAFMRTLVKVLFELGIENGALNSQWRLNSILSAANSFDRTSNYTRSRNSNSVNVVEKSSFNDPATFIVKNSKEISYNDPYDLNKIILKSLKNSSASYEPKTSLLPNQLNFDAYQVLDLAKMPDILNSKKVTPTTPQNFKEAIDLSFNHTDMVHFRIDHQWQYESRSPVGGDNNKAWGFSPHLNSDGSLWLGMRSEKNSIRLTTMAYRFKPVEFPELSLSLKVTKGPEGADPVIGKNGKDDSAFQLWVTLRDLRGVTDRTLGKKDESKVYTFGYYWGEEVSSEVRKASQIFENYYSNKNIFVATLPPAFISVLNSGNESLGKIVDYNLRIDKDIKRAYPALDINNVEIIAITLQMDSNDTQSTSEAYLKKLKFSPSRND